MVAAKVSLNGVKPYRCHYLLRRLEVVPREARVWVMDFKGRVAHSVGDCRYEDGGHLALLPAEPGERVADAWALAGWLRAVPLCGANVLVYGRPDPGWGGEDRRLDVPRPVCSVRYGWWRGVEWVGGVEWVECRADKRHLCGDVVLQAG